MATIINRIIELTGWVVLGVSTVLLVFASHIDNYQPPEQSIVAQKKIKCEANAGIPNYGTALRIARRGEER